MMKEFITEYWLEALFSVILTVLSFSMKKLFSRVKKEVEEQKCIKEGLVSILYDRIYQLCNTYIQQGWCSIEDRRNLEYLYKAYNKLGGNGTGTELHEKVKALPISPP